MPLRTLLLLRVSVKKKRSRFGVSREAVEVAVEDARRGLTRRQPLWFCTETEFVRAIERRINETSDFRVRGALH
jgi:hypothetical protein